MGAGVEKPSDSIPLARPRVNCRPVLVVRGRKNLTAALGRSATRAAIAIGNFDGVHRGHQTLIATARRLADASGGEVVALTFDPHPARLLAPSLAPPLIVSMERRAALLGEAGADIVVVEPFTREFVAIEADDFAADVLRGDLHAAHVVVGYDFSFGKGRRGDTTMLEELGARLGFGVSIVRRVSVHGLTCSSTKVREFALEGRVEGAEVLLGRPFELTGVVTKGAGRGRGIGFPTANLIPDADLIPKAGIYAARARILDDASDSDAESESEGRNSWACALSIGTNPTFVRGGALTVEAYLLDFEGDLYGRRVRVEFVQRLRDELRFDSVEALVAQIQVDVAKTRELVP
ncbi:MAG: bifunctional riboflavin kinase/FAD synthetase [Deltaproteobacteria bacterium]|nr:bifunctional riboflavin kinase/FAD synthetase [Deltaproteobacteria bacterium]